MQRGGLHAASNTVTVSVLHVPAAPASVTAPTLATVTAPTLATVTAPTLATVNVAFGVQWSAVSGATSYQLQQTESGGRNAVTTSYSGSATSKVITLGGLVDDDFQYAARACNSAGCSGWTNAAHSTYLQRKGTQNAMPASGGTL